jgi:4-amino-4-deoxy-L-arabinose transferase-like glycosyltransferase
MTALYGNVTLPSEATAFRRVAVVVGALTALRLVALHFSEVDLFFDESQYWSWSRELAFGYFSKPPLLAWLIAAAQRVCGDSEACIRAPAPLLCLGTSLLAYGIGRALYDSATSFWAAMLVAFGTGAIFSARIIATDVPLGLFWALALLAYVHLCRHADWRWALVLGGAIGAGLLAKYAMIYFVAGMLLAAWLDRDAAAFLRTRESRMALIVAAIIVSPNVLWNVDHGFLTLRHAGNAVIGEAIAPSVVRPFEFLAAQFAVFGPVVFGVAIAATARIGASDLRPADRVLLAFAIPPLAAVTLTATVVHAYANWAAASFVPLAVLAAAILVRQNLPILLWASVALGLFVQAALIGGDISPTRIRLPLPRSPNPYERTLGWKAYAHTVGELARSLGTPTVAADARSDVASLLYYWRDQPEQILAWPTSDLPNFELTRALTEAAPQPVLFVTPCRSAARLEKAYAKVTPLGIFVPSHEVARPFHAFRLEEPRGPIGPLTRCEP